jgi:hypothetical protein
MNIFLFYYAICNQFIYINLYPQLWFHKCLTNQNAQNIQFYYFNLRSLRLTKIIQHSSPQKNVILAKRRTLAALRINEYIKNGIKKSHVVRHLTNLTYSWVT